MQFLNGKGIAKDVVADSDVTGGLCEVDAFAPGYISPTCIQNGAMVDQHLLWLVDEDAINAGVEDADVPNDEVGAIFDIDAELCDGDWT